MRNWILLVFLVFCVWLSAGSCDRQVKPGDPPLEIAKMFPIEGPIADALRSSRKGWGLKSQSFDNSTVEALLVSDAIYVPETRQAALDTLFSRWRGDLTNISWIDVAFHRRPLFRSRVEFTRILATTELSDTNTAIGLYVKGRIDGRRFERNRTSIKALEFADTLPPSQKVKLLVKAAEAFNRTGETRRASDLMLGQLSQAAEIGGSPLEARVWIQLGTSLLWEDRFAEAMRCRVRGADLFGHAGVARKQLAGYSSIAEYLVVDGKSREAYVILEWAARRGQLLGLPHVSIPAMQALGFLLSDAGEHRLALNYQKSVLESVLAVQDSARVARRYLNIAEEYLQLGLMDSVKIALDEAKLWTELFPEKSIQWSVIIDESDYWLLEGDFEKADSLRAMADSLSQGYAEPYETALRHLKLADHGREMGRISQSHEALRKLRSLMDSEMIASSALDVEFHYHRSMAALRLETGETQIAWQHIKLCRERLKIRPSPERYSQYWLERARFAALGGDSAMAAQAFDSSLARAIESGRPLRINRGRLAFADWLLHADLPGKARAQVDSIVAPFGQTTSSGTAQLGELMRTRIALAEDDPRKAKKILVELNADTRVDLPADLRIDAILLLAECETALGGWRSANSHLALATELLREQQSRAGHSEIRRKQGDNLRQAYTRRIRLLLQHPELLSDDDPALATLALRLEMEAALWGKEPGPTPKPGMEPALAMLLDEEESYLWVVKGGNVTLKMLPARAEIEQAIRTLDNSIKVAGRARSLVSGEKLAAWFLSPLTDSWRPGQMLGVLPDRGMHGLPWAAFPWAGGSVLDHAAVVELTDLRNWDDVNRGKIDAGTLLSIGYNGERLEHAESEAREVGAIWPWKAEVLAGEPSLGPFRKIVAAGDYTAIHLAVHADVGRGLLEHAMLKLGTEEPEALPLTPATIQRLDIDSEFVFLSCCQASRGQNGSADAILDLARAFTEGGCRSVITSSLRIQDGAAKQLALRFYRALRAGSGPAEALRSAQISLRDDVSTAWVHPYYWAHYHVLMKSD